MKYGAGIDQYGKYYYEGNTKYYSNADYDTFMHGPGSGPLSQRKYDTGPKMPAGPSAT